MITFTETYDFLVSIIGTVPYGILTIDLEGEVTMCNELIVNHLQIDKTTTRLLERNLLDYITDIPSLTAEINKGLSKGRQPFDLMELEINHRYFNIRGRRILNGMIITTEDITQAKTLELTNLQAMLEGQESERQRLAKEIHDGIGPLISTIKLHLDGIKSDFKEQAPKATKKIVAMEELIQEVSTDIRGVSHALMPSALIDFGLVAALQNLCLKANDSGQVTIEFHHSGLEERLPQPIALGLFRIAQELLNNAFKYAKATLINVQLIKHKDSIMLTVEDDGVGFEPKQLQVLIDKGIGLQNILTRVKTLSGIFNIDTQLGKGVMSTIEIPFE